MTPLRIAFFGTPEFAVPTLQALHASPHQVVAVITQPDRARGRGQKSQAGAVAHLASELGVPLLQPERLRDETFLDQLRRVHADLGVVAAYGKILSETILAIPRLGLINVHASLLPRYRGAAPVHRAVMAGEPETGVTIMRVVRALDAGAMLSKVTRPIEVDETSVDVEQSLARLGAAALIDAVDSLAVGRATETPQDDSLATYAHKIEKTDGIVEWARSAWEIHNQIRGLHPWPHAFAELHGERTILLKSAVAETASPDHDVIAPDQPGAIVVAHGDRLEVQTGDGLLRLLVLQREGRRPLSAREFLAGRRLEPGTLFTRASQAS